MLLPDSRVGVCGALSGNPPAIAYSFAMQSPGPCLSCYASAMRCPVLTRAVPPVSRYVVAMRCPVLT
eukprot:357567-Rhodomonas_salina.2